MFFIEATTQRVKGQDKEVYKIRKRVRIGGFDRVLDVGSVENVEDAGELQALFDSQPHSGQHDAIAAGAAPEPTVVLGRPQEPPPPQAGSPNRRAAMPQVAPEVVQKMRAPGNDYPVSTDDTRGLSQEERERVKKSGHGGAKIPGHVRRQMEAPTRVQSEGAWGEQTPAQEREINPVVLGGGMGGGAVKVAKHPQEQQMRLKAQRQAEERRRQEEQQRRGDQSSGGDDGEAGKSANEAGEGRE